MTFKALISTAIYYFRCWRTLDAKERLQSSHWNGFSPVWVLMCTISWALDINARLQSSHWNGFSPVWVLMCTIRPGRVANTCSNNSPDGSEKNCPRSHDTNILYLLKNIKNCVKRAIPKIFKCSKILMFNEKYIFLQHYIPYDMSHIDDVHLQRERKCMIYLHKINVWKWMKLKTAVLFNYFQVLILGVIWSFYPKVVKCANLLLHSVELGHLCNTLYDVQRHWE